MLSDAPRRISPAAALGSLASVALPRLSCPTGETPVILTGKMSVPLLTHVVRNRGIVMVHHGCGTGGCGVAGLGAIIARP